jgi:hypothetical protein
LVIKALDPDPYWPPSGSSGSGSVKNEYGSETLSISQRYGSGSGSFYYRYQAEIVRKTMIHTAL